MAPPPTHPSIHPLTHPLTRIHTPTLLYLCVHVEQIPWHMDKDDPGRWVEGVSTADYPVPKAPHEEFFHTLLVTHIEEEYIAIGEDDMTNHHGPQGAVHTRAHK